MAFVATIWPSASIVGGPKMSERARAFLDHWLADHVASVDDTRRLRETVRLVTLCREVAVRAGLAPEELRKASGGDLRP